jgi:inward rectifier potassium channel
MTPRPDTDNRDLGLGGRLAESRARLMNPDGTFNIVRGGLTWRSLFHPYHFLLTLSWPRFFALVVVSYLAVNALFAGIYLACGPKALAGARPGNFADAFAFSVQTLATIGYGKMTPESFAAHVTVAMEALTGLLGFALVTGVVFARFSRPSVNVVFSDRAVVAPYRDHSALMFRIASGRRATLANVSARLTMTWTSPASGVRTFHTLALERETISFLALQWVIVHPINTNSPFHGVTREVLRKAAPEVMLLISGVDEAFFQSASTRTSYDVSQVEWGARFRDIYESLDDGRMYLDVSRLSETEAADLPRTPATGLPPLP